MAKLVLPDSNIYIGALRQRQDPFVALGGHADEWEFATCGIVALEVIRGIRDPRLLARTRAGFAVMIFVPTSNAIWDRATHLAWSLDRRGVLVPATDLLIAATALQVEAALLTRDAHFEQIPGLRVVDRLD